MRGRCWIVSVFSLSAFCSLPIACGGSTSKPDWPKGNIVLMDANNFTSVTDLNIPKVPTASGADLTVCWDGIKKDLLCHDVVAPDNAIENVGFLQIPNMSETQVKEKLKVGQLDENLVKVYRDFHTSMATAGSTCAMLSQFTLGTALMPATDYVAPAANQTITYMLLFTSGTTPGVGSKSMLFLEPSTTSAVMNVSAPDACDNGVLTFNATLGNPMAIPATDNTKWHIDWSQITKDSFGNPISFTKIDNVLIGFYQNKTAMDLQTGFKDIELTATTMYKATVAPGARDVDLVTATATDGSGAFPGFTKTDGVWAIAVRCSKCQIPAPVVMTILQPQ
jgi:hypothetical protein